MSSRGAREGLRAAGGVLRRELGGVPRPGRGLCAGNPRTFPSQPAGRGDTWRGPAPGLGSALQPFCGLLAPGATNSRAWVWDCEKQLAVFMAAFNASDREIEVFLERKHTQ